MNVRFASRLTGPFPPSRWHGHFESTAILERGSEEQPMASYEIGEQPGVGKYCCENCSDWSVELDDDSDKLPPCGKCGPGQEITYTDC